MANKIKEFGKKIIDGTVNNSPEILTGLTCGGVVGTAIMSGQASSKARDIIFQEEAAGLKELPFKEKFKLVWKLYIPTALMGGMTMVCAIGSNRIASNRVAAISSLYAITEKGLKEYQDKVMETIGEKKEKAIHDEVAKDRIEKDPVSKNEVILTGDGDFLCYDAMYGGYFRSTIDKIKKVENDMNHELLTGMDTWVSLNEVRYELKREPIKGGELIGWTIDELIHFSFSTQLTEDGEPCLVIEYNAKPKPKIFN